MEKHIVNVSDNSNLEINDESTELLLQGVCKSFECDDFRNNECRMRRFLDIVEESNWEYSQIWETPSKFILHIIKYSNNSHIEILGKMNELQVKWNCLTDEESCNCAFFDEMKNLKRKLEELIDKPEQT